MTRDRVLWLSMALALAFLVGVVVVVCRPSTQGEVVESKPTLVVLPTPVSTLQTVVAGKATTRTVVPSMTPLPDRLPMVAAPSPSATSTPDPTATPAPPTETPIPERSPVQRG